MAAAMAGRLIATDAAALHSACVVMGMVHLPDVCTA